MCEAVANGSQLHAPRVDGRGESSGEAPLTFEARGKTELPGHETDDAMSLA